MFSRLIIASFFVASSCVAFQTFGGPACSGSGACSYAYTNSNGNNVVVNGFCAPNGFCADNGATCSTPEQCYNDCGSGVCGGVGASCNTQNAFAHNQFDMACNTPSTTCTTDGTLGACVVSGASARARSRRSIDVNACPTDLSRCPVTGGGFECLDTKTNLESCGACPGFRGYRDCSEIANAMDVQCIDGGCVVHSCETGYRLFANACLRHI